VRNWEDKWRDLRFVIVCLLCLAVFIFIGIGIKAAIMPSEFKGYYLVHSTIGYRVYADWTNSIDLPVYSSYDAQTTLTVYGALLALEEARKPIEASKMRGAM